VLFEFKYPGSDEMSLHACISRSERGRRKKEVRQGTREQMMGGEKERSENCFYTKAQATEASYR
jgi:hypothetical protein